MPLLWPDPQATRENNNTKLELLLSNGYKIFFHNSENYDNFYITPNTIDMNRIFISGKSLRENTNTLSRFFDCEKVYDHTSRNVSFYT